MFDFLRRAFGLVQPSRRPEFPGVVPDPRTREEKEMDYEAREVLPPRAPEWEEKPKNEWRRMPTVKDQDGSSACVAFGTALALGHENELEEGKYIDLSPRSIYPRRENNSPGMWLQNALHIAYKNGCSLETLLPSNGRDEAEMNSLEDEKEVDRQFAQVVKPGGYFQAYNNDFDQIATALDTGKVVVAIIRFESGQFRNPVFSSTKDGYWGHLVDFTDRTLYNGKKGLVTANSWGKDWGWDGYGILLEDRAEGLQGWGFFEELDNDWVEEDKEGIEKPEYQFNTPIAYHDNNKEVAKLQECLKWEETFPKNIPCTGWYGQITAKAVYDFQVKHEVAPMDELDALQGMRVGPKTRAKLNELF